MVVYKCKFGIPSITKIFILNMDIMSQIKFIISAIVSAFLLSNCAVVAVGAAGAAAGATAAVVTDPRRPPMVIDDNKLETKLQYLYNSKYANSEKHSKSNIYVHSYNGTILLTGQVPDIKTKENVEFDAKVTPGVKHIYSYLTIRLPQSISSRSNDSLITTSVRTQIFRLSGIKSSSIKVITTNAVVYLFGILNKDDAQTVANTTANVSGVEKVITLFEYINY